MNDIENAMTSIRRRDFLPEDMQDRAASDVALPIGYGQSNSQPTTVYMMLEWLNPQPGDVVLDVGSGSGWTTALVAHLVGPHGKVYAVEKVPELVRFGAENCRRAGITNAAFYEAGTVFGLPEFGPYDAILVSATAAHVPEELLEQLKVGGCLVIPVGNSVYEIEKTGPEAYETIEHPGFVFVPLVG